MGIIINGIQDNNIRPRHQECFKADLIPKCEGRTARDVSRQLGAGANVQPDGNRSRKVKRATARVKENPREEGMVSPVVARGVRVKVVNQTNPTKIRNVDTVRKWVTSRQTAENA